VAAGPGLRAVALFNLEGKRLAEGGSMPDGVTPSQQPQWLDGGLLVSHEARFNIDEALPGGPPAPRFGRMGPPPGLGPPALRGPVERDPAEELLKGPVLLAALLDDSPYRRAVGAARTRFIVSSLITLSAVLMGLALVALIQRHGRLAAELGMAREREKRLEELTRLGAGLAHETKNPLNLIRGLAQQWLARFPGDSEAHGRAQQIIDEADRVVGRINSFLNYSRPPLRRMEEADLGQLLAEMAAVFRDEAAAKGVTLRVEGQSARVQADSDMLRQVAANLLANALQACREGDSIEIALKSDARGRFSFSVRDTGEGIAPEDLPQVAKPYFTRRAGGTGLGLAIVEQIAQAHGWRLEIESAAGQGTTARIAGMQEAA
ncbi:MAG: ATP-binding protein, partial [Candidatus Sumerlaeota bacterium]|nr:ATP-binding protein [Candidatus Sumerlaeota bacterium]